ncbi:hypothetical protein [Duganella sp. BJB1802]|nr:hypothetical protein [Duganella sp. BJB1802]
MRPCPPHQSLQARRVDGAGLASAACAAGEVGVIGIAGPERVPLAT